MVSFSPIHLSSPLQCSCLENPRDGGALWAAVYGVAQSWTQLKRFSSSSSSIQHIFLCPRNSPSKHTAVGCHSLLQGIFPTQGSNSSLASPSLRGGSLPAEPPDAKSLQSCPTLCDPIDGSPPGSPVPGILQARTLEWAANSFSNA